jgi:hypothetical protein
MQAENFYHSTAHQLPGTSTDELMKLARREFHTAQKRTPRRQAHVRSRYFTKDKVFINQFWDHLDQKNRQDKVRRLKLYTCALDLIRNTTVAPQTMQNPNNADEILHRFSGKTANGTVFYVQIKENKKNNRKDFMSVFPAK